MVLYVALTKLRVDRGRLHTGDAIRACATDPPAPWLSIEGPSAAAMALFTPVLWDTAKAV